MSMYNRKTETSSPSDFLLPLKKRMRPFDDVQENLLAPPAKKVAFSGNAKYKGVVQHHNGHWGAQIYIDHKRIWLGTFKSAAEAAMSYDSASMKLRGFDAKSYRNFPCSGLTVYEPDFQKRYTTEAVLDMIRDGSYQQRFREFLRLPSQSVTSINIVGSEQARQGGDEGSNKCVTCTELFQKELTLSDVGKLNRLVIPKKYAVKYLPFVNDDRKEREEGEIVEDAEVVFYDREMRQWRFRYCYWKSSQSFVFTSGWKGFVREKNLKERDVVVFYTCDVPTLEGGSKSLLMIDVHCLSNTNSNVTEKVNETFYKIPEKLKKTEEKHGEFMLFGVMISSNKSVIACH